MDIKTPPVGTQNFIDANVFIYHLADLSDECYELVGRVALWGSDETIKYFPPPESVKPYCQQRTPADPKAFAHFTREEFSGG